MQKSHPLHINIPISKIDEEQRMVWGYATVEELDAHGEIIGYEASKKAFPRWLGNIREMHGDKAIGKRIDVQFNDADKGVWLGAYISESADGENAWTKVKEGILQAYSIGGNINDFKMVKIGGADHLMVTDYDLYEVSLVDNPACPSAMLQVVKNAGGVLRQAEQIKKGFGRPVHWWETMHRYAPSQSVIKSQVMIYNKDGMTKQSRQLVKDIFSAGELVELGMYLADFIWFSNYEGKDTTDLQAALTSIKQAAATELGEDENFPEVVYMAVEEACTALNITKLEELQQMVKDKKNLGKANVVDGVERDSEGNVVEPAAPAEPTQVTVNKPGDAPADPVKPAAATTDPEEPAGDLAPEDNPVDPKATTDAPADPTADKGAAAGDIEKTTDSELAKLIAASVGQVVEKAIAPLQAEIDALKKQPAASKRATSYSDVEKTGGDVTKMDEKKTEFDELMQKANDFAAHPEKGSVQDRVAIGIKLRKLSRQMDPASVAQNNAIRASFGPQ
jgi:HK97 family phage prohead protease